MDPNIKEISIDKVGDVYEPPAVGKPPLQVIETTKDRMKIGWTEQWYEVVATKEQAELVRLAMNGRSDNVHLVLEVFKRMEGIK